MRQAVPGHLLVGVAGDERSRVDEGVEGWRRARHPQEQVLHAPRVSDVFQPLESHVLRRREHIDHVGVRALLDANTSLLLLHICRHEARRRAREANDPFEEIGAEVHSARRELLDRVAAAALYVALRQPEAVPVEVKADK